MQKQDRVVTIHLNNAILSFKKICYTITYVTLCQYVYN